MVLSLSIGIAHRLSPLHLNAYDFLHRRYFMIHLITGRANYDALLALLFTETLLEETLTKELLYNIHNITHLL